jgi:fimbrial chaperone protein
MRFLPCIIAGLLLSVPQARAQSGSLRVTPILLDVAAPGAATTLTLRNEGSRDLNVQLRVFRWTGTRNEPVLEPTRDVVISPPAAKLVPGTEYVARVVRVAKQPVTGEESYRILVDEIPDAASARPSAEIKFVMRYSIPVFFAVRTAPPPDIAWSFRTEDGKPVLAAANKGGRRIRVADMVLTDSTGAVVLRHDGLVGYALAGSSASWALPAKTAVRRGPLKMVAKSEAGVIDAMVAVSSPQ